MKSKTIYIIMTVAAALLAGSTIFAQSYERVIVKKFDVKSNPNIHVEGRFGPITVTGATSNTVEVSIKIKVEEDSREDAKRVAEQVDVRIEGNRDQVSVRADLSKNDRQNENTKITISLLVPQQTVLTVENKFGNTEIKSINGSVNANNQFGVIKVTGSRNLDVSNSFGDIMVGNITGTCKVEGKNGKIKAFTISGGKFYNKFGSTEVENVQGKLEISSSMGSVSAKNIYSAVIVNKYGSVYVEPSSSFGGTVKANTSFGSIKSDYPLETKNSSSTGLKEEAFGRIGTGTGELRLTNNFGEIKIRKK